MVALTLRINSREHKRLKLAAAYLGMTASDIIRLALAERLAQLERTGAIPRDTETR